MLADTLVERYDRQILLPEVGGRGQERLCASRVVVAGDDAAATFAVDLLARAGVGVETARGAPGGLRVDTGGPTAVVACWHGSGGIVATLAGQPCAACLPAWVLVPPVAGPTSLAGPAVAHAIGALVAAEALAVLLGLVATGRAHVIDLAHPRFEAYTLVAGAGCAACGDPA